MGKLIDISGQVFGRLKVIAYVGKNKSRHSQWLCECKCNNKIIVSASNLKNGQHTILWMFTKRNN